MATKPNDYGSLPEDKSPPIPKTLSKRALASAVVAVMLFAAAAAATFNSKTATAPAALAAYDGSGVRSPRGN